MSNGLDKEALAHARMSRENQVLPAADEGARGRLVKVEGVGAPKGKGKKNAERTRDVEPKLTLGIDAVTLARVGRKASGTKVTLGEDVFATKVMILADSEPEK